MNDMVVVLQLMVGGTTVWLAKVMLGVHGDEVAVGGVLVEWHKGMVQGL